MKRFSTFLLAALLATFVVPVVAQSTAQWQMIVTVSFSFPGPVLALQDAHSEVHNVILETQSFRLWVQDFVSQEDCLSSTMYQNVPMVFTNALGVLTPETITANFVKCERQPVT